MKTNLRIGEVLMERGCITQEQMEQALAYQKEHREKRVGQILIELGFITETHVLEALAARLGLEIVSIGQMQVELAAVRLIPRELAEKQNLLAVRASEGSLEIVTNDPLNYFAFEEVRQLTGCHVVIRLSELGPLQSAIRYYYAEVGAQQAAQTANEGFAGSDAELVHIEESESGDPEAPIVKLLSSLLDRAVSTGASDIHIEPFEGKTRVRMRIDGTIVDYVTLERSVHQPLIARIKIMANLDIAERRLPQDGHFRIRAGQEGHVNIRVSLLPTVFGEKAVLRILAAAGEHFHGRGPGGAERAGHQPDAGQSGRRADVRVRSARAAASGPGHHHGRRDPRWRDRRDLGPRRHHRPSGAEHAAHKRCGLQRCPSGGHGR